jgi:hypothetical protein
MATDSNLWPPIGAKDFTVLKRCKTTNQSLNQLVFLFAHTLPYKPLNGKSSLDLIIIQGLK